MLRIAVAATAAFGCVLAGARPAASQETTETPAVVGQWELSFDTPRGSRTLTLTFEIDGGELKGSAETPRGTVQLQEVRLEGDQVSFSMPFGRGGQGRSMQFTGTLAGDAMEGRLRLPRGNQERPWTAKRVEE